MFDSLRGLDPNVFFTPGDKGYLLFANPLDSRVSDWPRRVPVRIRAMLLAGDRLIAAGPPDIVDPQDPLGAFEGRKGGVLYVINTANGWPSSPCPRRPSSTAPPLAGVCFWPRRTASWLVLESSEFNSEEEEPMRLSVPPVAVWFSLGLAAFCTAAAADPAVQPPKGAPEYQAPPRTADGANMVLTVQKLEKGFDPERPLLIWAIGSSFTNGLGNGDLLIELIRQRFPNAPPIVYKRMAGNSTSYHFSHGWARHLVIPDQPDVVLIYNFGKTEDVDAMIAELRRHTTADVLVGSLHWCLPHKPVWPDPEVRNSHQEPAALRAMREKYGVEFVENRREMTQYMVEHGLVPEDLLADSVHENRYASKMTVMNIARHFHRADKFAYEPESRERRIEAEAPAGVETDAGKWTAAEDGAARTATGQGSALSVRFTGNRIELIGWRDPRGGTAEVWIDGKPAAEIEAFYVGYIQPDKQNAPLPPNPPRDRCPHAVSLGTNIVPQSWTMTMTSDTGDYELVGSVTGPDGSGNGLTPFTSKSGQIVVDPAFWRDAKNNRSGDRFTFEVFRATAATVDFKGTTREKFRLRLADYLSNGPHVVKLVARGDGAVTVDAFDVFQPPLK